MVIQILITLASAFVILKSVVSYSNRSIRLPTFVVWSLFWVAIIFFVWQPSLADRVASLLQVGRGADAMFYLSLIVIFYLLFKIFIRFERIDFQVTTLVREIALLRKEIDDIKK